MTENPSEINHIEFTKVIANHRLTKQIVAVDASGKVTSGDAPFLSSGQFERVILSPDTALRDLFVIMAACGPNEALITGSLVPPGDPLTIVTKSALARGVAGVAKTKDNFRASRLVVVDIDLGDAPDKVRERFRREGVVGTLKAIVPQFAGVGVVQRASTSSFVMDARSGGNSGGRGYHIYFLVNDPLDWLRAAKAIEALLRLAGLGFAVIRANGHVDLKTPLDIKASTDPSRLVFEGPAVFADPALSYEPGKREPRVREGGPLDTRAVPDLSMDEIAELADIDAKLRAEVAGDAARVTNAHRAANPHWGEIHELTGAGGRVPEFVVFGDTPIHLDDGRVVTAIDVLLDPDAFDGLTCADLDEPNYGGGRNLGRIYARCRHPYVWSQAHSGRKFFLRVSADDLVRILAEGV